MAYYRLKSDFDQGHGREPIKAGTLMYSWALGGHRKMPVGIELSVWPSGQGVNLDVPRDQIEGPNPEPKAGEFAELIAYYLRGSDVPPNLIIGSPETLDDDLDGLAHNWGEYGGGRVKVPGDTGYGQIAMVALPKTQGGALTGEAKVLFYSPKWGKQGPRTAKFKLCDHAHVAGASANPSRGWHPGRCSKCGLDMTVDSSD